MKKMIVVLAIALASALAQAAQVTWNATQISNPSDSSAKLSGAVAFLFDAATISSADLKSSIEAGKFSSASALDTGTSNATGAINRMGTVLPSSYLGGNSVTLYAVIFDSSDTTSGNYLLTKEVTVALKGTGSTTFAFGSQAGATWTKYGSDVPGSDTPEPTSGLLLLIGGAMLALRRKQK